MFVSHHIVDGVGDGAIYLFGNDKLKLIQQFVLQAVERQECDKGEDEDEQWWQGGEE